MKNKMTKKIELSIVVPAYNEEKRILNCIKEVTSYFDKKGVPYELVIVNDGSTDNTKKIVEQFAKKNSKVIDAGYEKNRGKGFAVKTGVLKAKGEKILFSDADLSTPIKDFEKLDSWYKKGFDVCVGSRRLSGSKISVKQPLHRRIIGKVFITMVQMLSSLDLKDTQCGFKLFNSRKAKKIFSEQKIDGFSFDVEVLYLAKKKGYSIKEVPVEWNDSEKYSKVNPIKESFKMLSDLIKIRKMHG